jgi:mono/diheme cytochrome c family protein
MKRPAFLALLGLGLCLAPAPGAVVRAAPVDYARDVKPLLARHCVSCHGAAKPRGGLRLDTAAAAVKGGKSGPSVVPGHADESPLIEAVLGEGTTERMPLKRPPLSDRQVATLRAWIDQGAGAPADEVPTALNETHWAFTPPKRPAIPAVPDPAWAASPIDALLRARMDKEGIRPSFEADRVTLIRRATFDLTGLPPTPAEVTSFVEDPRTDAYEIVVDRLLASAHYGERWARHWLDQARYADSNGYSIDAPRSIWKYRDWVIDSLNRDLSFDRFLTDQLAGDLRPGATLEQRVATGFHRNTMINQEGGIDKEQFRVESIVDRVNTTGTVFLGLSVGCAQCHDHKYDPISQREYYAFYAFFNSVDEPDLELGTPGLIARRDAVRAEIAAWHERLTKEHPDVLTKVREWEKTLDPDSKVNQPPELKLAFDVEPDKRTASQARLVMELFLSRSPGFKTEHAAIAALRAREPRLETTMVVRERPTPRPTFVHVGGDFTRQGANVSPGVPAIFSPVTASHGGTPNRLDLARWLTDPGHPLTARVTVNRLWQVYFGKGLVETENDFGTQGTPPSHPELLDWLATEFVARGWSLKAMHRLIATSKAYRQSSHARPELDKVDPANRLLARQSRLRLDAEVIRDAALSVAGLLSGKVGGPSVYPPQPDGVMTLGQMKRPWVVSDGPDRYRRGLYTFFWRATPYPALTVFDAPNAIQSCTRRNRSNTPLQALTLLNDPSFVECASALGGRVLREGGCDDPGRLDAAFRLCLGRGPSAHEAKTLAALLAEERGGGTGGSPTSAPSGAERALAGEPPVQPDRDADRAAWTTVARVLLNLDEFITRE